MTPAPFQVTGLMSIFGGPEDLDVSPSEGLALIEPSDLSRWQFGHLFLRMQPPATTGLARRLNPNTFYLACRWPYNALADTQGKARELLRHSVCKVSANGKCEFARLVDWGPNQNTGRVADLSPALAAALDLGTNDIVTVELIPAFS